MSMRGKKVRHVLFPARRLIGLASVVFLAGCVTGGVERHRMARYRPSHEGRNLWVTEESGSQDGQMEPGDAPQVNGGDSEPVVDAESTRTLGRGDRVLIYLRAIPVPEDLRAVVDDRGKINLPHIGKIEVEGMTTSRAETFIEKKYIEEGIYNRITVILVAQEYEYFVQGEIKRPGKYPLSGETTLSQAVAQAGGATDFGNLKKVDILRGRETLRFNLNEIEKGEEKNPIIEPGDVIRVNRGLW